MHNLKNIIRLITMIRPLIKKMFISIIFGILGNASAIIMLIASAILITYLIPEVQYNEKKFVLLFFIAAGAALLRGLLRYIEQLSGHDVAFRLLASLRDKIYQKLRTLAPAKLIDKRSGDIVSMLMGDIEYIEVFFAHTLAPIVIAFVVSIGVLVFLSFYWIGFSLILLFFFITVGIIIPVINYQLGNTAGKRYRNKLAETNSFMLDALLGLREILLFRKIHEIKKKNYKLGLSLADETRRFRKKESMVTAFANLSVLLAIGTTLSVAVLRFSNNQISLDTLIIVTVTAASSFGPLYALSLLSNDILQTFAAVNRLFRFFDEPPAVNHNGTVQIKEENFESIEFQNVTFSYTLHTPVLDSVSFSIKKGEHIGIIGKSGSGKSTLFRLLLRFYDTTNGSIKMNGYDINHIQYKSLNNMYSVVTQDSFLFHESIRANIQIGNELATKNDIINAAKKANIHDFIMSLPHHYETSAGELGIKLSAGQRQRIAIARALIKNSPVILLDEPTSHLDTLNEKEIIQTIYSAFKDKTVCIISHRPSTVYAADKIIVLENGKICETGSYKSLMNTDTAYKRISKHEH